MTRKRLNNILGKEWELLAGDRGAVMMVTLLPLLIVGQGTIYIWAAAHFGGEAMLSSSMLQASQSRVQEAIPALIGLPDADQLRVVLLSQFNFYLLLIPTMIAINFATFSIVDEKLSGSLEPLLATPVRTWELLLGKALAGVIPAIMITWVCAGIFLALVASLGWGHLLSLILSPSYFMVLFLVAPAVSALSFLLGVMGSSRAKDAKSAQNFVVVIVLPVLALIGVQVAGLVWFTGPLTLGLAIGLALLDLLALRVAVPLFQRESIVVNWR